MNNNNMNNTEHAVLVKRQACEPLKNVAFLKDELGRVHTVLLMKKKRCLGAILCWKSISQFDAFFVINIVVLFT